MSNIGIVDKISQLIPLVDENDRVVLNEMLDKYLRQVGFDIVSADLLVGLDDKTTKRMMPSLRSIRHLAQEYVCSILGYDNDSQESCDFFDTCDNEDDNKEGTFLGLQIQRYYVYHNTSIDIRKEVIDSFDLFALYAFVGMYLRYAKITNL